MRSRIDRLRRMWRSRTPSRDPKIFGIGAHKTGTTSLTRAMTILGFSVASERTWYKSPRFREQVLAGDLRRLWHWTDDPEFTFYEDSPFALGDVYVHLLDRYPQARFILTSRDPAEWAASLEAWAAEKYVTDQLRREARFGYGLIGDGHRSELIRGYEARNRAIQEHIPAQQLLILDIAAGDGWDRLCPFLGVDVPAVEFPHLNRYTSQPAPTAAQRTRAADS